MDYTKIKTLESVEDFKKRLQAIKYNLREFQKPTVEEIILELETY